MVDIYCLAFRGLSLRAQALVIIICEYIVVHKKLSCSVFGTFRAGEPELSNLKEKGVRHYPA